MAVSPTSDPLTSVERLRALRRLAILDTPPEEAYDRLTRLATRLLGVPIALVNLIDEERQFFKSAVGMGELRELPIGTGVCSYAVATREPLVLEDARQDPRFSSNPIVTEHGLVSYVGIPLITAEGHALGTFCVVDTEPRRWSGDDIALMSDLASAVLTEIELRSAGREAARSAEEAEAARAAADAARQTLQETVEGLDAIVWEADEATWQFSFVSAQAEEMLGYPVEQWLADPEFWKTYIHPEDHAHVVRRCTAETAAGRNHDVQYRAVAADGRVLWLHDHISLIRDATGQVVRLRGMMVDVTASKAVEAALRESEARHRSLTDDVLDTSEVGTFILSSDFHIVWANRAVAKFFGLDRDGILGSDKRALIRQRIADVVQDAERFSSTVLAAYDDNTYAESFECRVLAGEGREERWLAHWSQPIVRGLYAGGRIEHYYDITDRKRAEDAEREEARLVATLQRIGRTLASELDRDILLQTVTEAATELAGAEVGAFVYNGRNDRGEAQTLCRVSGEWKDALEEVLGAETTPPFEPANETAVIRSDDLTQDAPRTLTRFQAAVRDGNPLVRSYLSVPVVARCGEVLGGLLFGHRETGRFSERHERLGQGIAGWAAVALDNARLYEAARRAAREREEMVAIVSHDLRNPLNTIGMSSALLTELELTKEQQAVQIGTIRRAAAQMTRLVADLLDVTRSGAGRLKVSPRRENAEVLVRDAEELARPLAAAKGCGLVLELADDLPAVRADRERVLQVFSNMIGNAIDFTPSDGRITLGAAREEGTVRFSVADTGVGIPAADLPNIFDQFWQGRTPGRQGTGLGLAIAKAIVEAHGGRISADTVPGSGAILSFTIPVAG